MLHQMCLHGCIRCVSMVASNVFQFTTGVPVSTQWEMMGHYYPIQIAQFGLSHYSKHITEGKPDQMLMLTGDNMELEQWQTSSKTTVRSLWDQTKGSQVVEFHSSGII